MGLILHYQFTELEGENMLEKIVVVLIAILLVLSGCSGGPPKDLGLQQGKFAPCPEKPNCVSSMEPGRKRYIAPFPYRGDRERARSVLKEVLREQRTATLKEETDEYLHAEFRSAVFGFVDDVEFYLPEDVQHIDIRSASRLGYWDIGTNRRRLERIREHFTQASAQ